eukprot:scaffold241145_cov28-Tisochrysis_lutea.AAC.3
MVALPSCSSSYPSLPMLPSRGMSSPCPSPALERRLERRSSSKPSSGSCPGCAVRNVVVRRRRASGVIPNPTAKEA